MNLPPSGSVRLRQFHCGLLPLAPSRSLIRTVRLCCVFQFARRPLWFSGVLFTSVAGKDASVLRAEIKVLLLKDAIEPVSPARMKKGFYSTLLHHTKERQWVTTDLISMSFEFC